MMAKRGSCGRVIDSSDYAAIGNIKLPKAPLTGAEINAWLATLPPVPLAGEGGECT